MLVVKNMPANAGDAGSRTGASQGFPRAAAPVGVFSRGTTRMKREGDGSCGVGDGTRRSSLPESGGRGPSASQLLAFSAGKEQDRKSVV